MQENKQKKKKNKDNVYEMILTRGPQVHYPLAINCYTLVIQYKVFVTIVYYYYCYINSILNALGFCI